MSKQKVAVMGIELLDQFIEGMKELNEKFLIPQDAKMYERQMKALRESVLEKAAGTTEGGEAGGRTTDSNSAAE